MEFKQYIWAQHKFGNQTAPNGKKVADNFIEWFGDSTVLYRGEPRVVYHGSRNPATSSFADDMQGKGVVSWGMNLTGEKYGGFFFTSSKENAEYYADHKRTPMKLIPDMVNVMGDDKKGYYYFVADNRGNGILNDGPYKTEEEAELQGKRHVERYNQMKKKRKDLFVTPVYLRITNPFEGDHSKSPSQHIKEAKAKGHDGVFVPDYLDGAVFSDIYIVFASTQVKAVQNNGNYDSNANGIFD